MQAAGGSLFTLKIRTMKPNRIKIGPSALRLAILLGVLIGGVQPLTAQQIRWQDASTLPLYGKVSDATESRYERLPATVKAITREPLRYLGTHSAGLYIRFRSNSTAIHARWEAMYDCEMNHMTPVGIKGLDLYALLDGKWRHVRSALPNGKCNESPIIEYMQPLEREYMLYLPLYDGITSLEIGVDTDATLAPPAIDRPTHRGPIVMYGTSILQGGCANRPGMAHTAIISRQLDREVINLGFSGNALLDREIGELMASVESPSLFVMDYVPNASAEAIDKEGEAFFHLVRDRHPKVPVIFVEDPIFPHSAFDQEILKEVMAKNRAQRNLFLKLKRAGEKRIYYVGAEGMIGDDGEATVDGIHFTDLGAVRYVEHLMPTLKKALRKGKQK